MNNYDHQQQAGMTGQGQPAQQQFMMRAAGGAGPPMGGAPGMNMQQMTIQQQQQHMQQQRMMMQQQQQQQQQQGRQMYAGGPMPMGPQGYNQQQMFQQQAQQLLQRMPPSLQEQYHRETNPQKKAELMQRFRMMHVQRQQQLQQQQQAAGGGGQQGQMLQGGGMAGQAAMRMQPAAHMPHQPYPPHVMARMAQPGQQPPVSAAAHMQAASGAPPQPIHPTMQHPPHMSASPQVAAPGSQQPAHSVADSPQLHAMHYSQSPATMGGSVGGGQPGTPGQRSDGGPQSMQSATGSAAGIPSVQADEKTPEYMEILAAMKAKHMDGLKRIMERCRVDGVAVGVRVERMMEILEEKRTVKLQLLERLHTSMDAVLEEHLLTYPLLEAIRAVDKTRREKAAAGSPPAATVPTAAPPYPDPWKQVRHLSIRVPEHIAKLYKDEGDCKSSRKRGVAERVWNSKSGRYDVSRGGASDAKRVKEERVDAVAEAASPACLKAEEAPRVQLDCSVDGRRWHLSEAASKELAGVSWRADAEHAPSTQHAPDVVVCVDSDELVCAPLRVLVPATYPTQPAVVLYDRSFPSSSPLSAQLSAVFERVLSSGVDRGLAGIATAFSTACKHMLRLQQQQPAREVYHTQVLA